MNPSLVTTETSDGILLHGYFSPAFADRPVLLHIHGFESNFYENPFILAIHKHLQEAGISFLTVNTRGHDIYAHHELIEDAYLDIDAWIQFLLDHGYSNIVLQGHSLGSVKSVRYLFEGSHAEHVSKLILLSPFDKKGTMTGFFRDQADQVTLDVQEKVDSGQGHGLIPRTFSSMEMSYLTFLSWYKQDALGRMFEFCSGNDYDFPVLKKIPVPVKVIVGSKDEYFHPANPRHPEEAVRILESHIPDCRVTLLPGANHEFVGQSQTVAREVLSFLH
jgi:pimeloyl-ACP methyl ester carboxylesterase